MGIKHYKLHLIETVVLLGEGDSALTVEIVRLLSVTKIQISHLLNSEKSGYLTWKKDKEKKAVTKDHFPPKNSSI